VTLLIVDASVARSCNDPATSIEAANCFLFLQEISDRRNATGVVVNPELEREWDIHASRTFNKWLANMETRRRVHRVEEKRSADYRAVVSAVENEGIRVALEKDLHLVELALLGQHPVVSRDDKQRDYVRDLMPQHSLLASVQWLNPVTYPDWTSWFARGCDRQTFALGGDS
jgi:hypothetical protein